MNDRETQRTFCVVLLAASCARVRREDGQLLFTGWPTDSGPVEIRVFSQYATSGGGVEFATCLQIEVTGPAASLDHAMLTFTGASLEVAAVLALCTNAAIGAPQWERAYETTPLASERELRQNLSVLLENTERRMRAVDRVSSALTVAGLEKSQHRPRLLRAIRQYWFALGHFTPGSETLCLAHVYMGVEALAKVALDLEVHKRSVSPSQLADLWGLDERERGRLQSSLENHARRRLVFLGDGETHRKAKHASDGFEHGFEDLSAVWSLANEVREKAAGYLRSSLLCCAHYPEKVPELLVTPPFDFVVHAGAPSAELAATIHGRGEPMGPAVGEHPGFDHKRHPSASWKSGADHFTVEHRGQFSIRLSRRLRMSTPRMRAQSAPVDAEGADTKPIWSEVTPATDAGAPWEASQGFDDGGGEGPR